MNRILVLSLLLILSATFILGCNSTSTKNNQTSNATALENPVFAGVSVSDEVKKEVWARDGGKCVACGGTTGNGFAHKTHPDKGGKSTADNLEVRCKNCYNAN
ncbi:MAG: hypothetical protein AABZ60_00150 [Planctomycetota bacterium]